MTLIRELEITDRVLGDGSEAHATESIAAKLEKADTDDRPHMKFANMPALASQRFKGGGSRTQSRRD